MEIKFRNEKDLFEYLDREIEGLKKTNGEDLIPHMVLSHGFIEYWNLLCRKSHSLVWRGTKAEEGNGISFEELVRVLYNRFFVQISELPSMSEMDKEKKDRLRDEGFSEYLND